MIEQENKNLCETCELVDFMTGLDKEGKETRGYQCPYAEKHYYSIDRCNHYSNPSSFQKLLRSKSFKVFAFILLFGALALLTMLILK